MGVDTDEFVYPERISSELKCPICTLVLEAPIVLTEYEHLYCESCLLDWMAVKPICPLTQQPLHPDKIRPPGRIITNMIGELERYCGNRKEGCPWQGEQQLLATHCEGCTYRPRGELIAEINKYKKLLLDETTNFELEINRLDSENCSYQEHISNLEVFIEQQTEQIDDLKRIVANLSAKLKMYDKLHHEGNAEVASPESDLSKLQRLRGVATGNARRSAVSRVFVDEDDHNKDPSHGVRK